MSKKILIAICITTVALICLCAVLVSYKENADIKTIQSIGELNNFYYHKDESALKEIVANTLAAPLYIIRGFFSNIGSITRSYNNSITPDYYDDIGTSRKSSGSGITPESITASPTNADSSSSNSMLSSIGENSSKEYSTTNIQVENVDEADITKTDGDYIYSISDDNVIITNASVPEEIKVEATIKSGDGSIPEDLILYNNKLVIIATNSSSNYYKNNSNTMVKIYDITNKSKPNMVKSFELYEPYYTSRCINNELYIISSGTLRLDSSDVERKYKENREEQEIPLNKIKYLKDVTTDKQTIIATMDLNNIDNKIDLNSYLIDISNAYVSENGIYLLDEKYNSSYYNNRSEIASIFGFKGIFGLFDYEKKYDYSSKTQTEIYKFGISNDGLVTYNCKTKTDGETINQYSLDEKNGHLRVALYDSDGARVVIFNENLEQIGATSYFAKGEKMYSSRFIGDKAYLVTYQTVDPLFVIDLSNETKPKVLGELKIPGYSTYLHPYDENHLIGIGMQTQETVNKNSSGKVISTTARITGMKMALFDISDVNNPEQISETVIGDSRTTSAILTNPKALLFSKEKELIAIPVNNYAEDFGVSSSEATYSSMINTYKNYSKPYISEGYLVYKINLTDGFNLKGVITHEANKKDTNKKYNYSYYTTTKLLRGMYIDNNLYTVSESAVKVNNLETLDLIKELKLK